VKSFIPTYRSRIVSLSMHHPLQVSYSIRWPTRKAPADSAQPVRKSGEATPCAFAPPPHERQAQQHYGEHNPYLVPAKVVAALVEKQQTGTA